MKTLQFSLAAFVAGILFGMATCNSCHSPCKEPAGTTKDSTVTHTDTVPIIVEMSGKIDAPQPVATIEHKTFNGSYPVYITKDSFVLAPVDTAAIVAAYIATRDYSQAYPLGLDTVRVQSIVQGNRLIGQGVNLSHHMQEIRQTIAAKPKGSLLLSGTGYYYKGNFGLGAGALYLSPKKIAIEGGIVIMPSQLFYYASYKVPLWK